MSAYKLTKADESNHNTIVIILHGISEGCESAFIKNISDQLTMHGFDNLRFNFSYLEKGLGYTKDNVDQEVSELNQAIIFSKEIGYSKFIFVGKSLGGIVASYWLAKYGDQLPIDKVIILGLVINEISLVGLNKAGSILIIQGEFDKFGNKAAVVNALTPMQQKLKIIEIKGADHSYRNMHKKPEFQNLAVTSMIENL